MINILLVEKSRAEYLFIGGLLSDVHHSDYCLRWISDIDNALDAALQDDVDVVLLDYSWGRGLAVDFLKSAQFNGCAAPIIVMTSEMEAEVDRSAIRHGASDYLIKGQINGQLLERTLRYAIERKQTEHRLSRLAHYDPLTQVPNRILFRDRLEHAISTAERDNVPFALMYIDLDGFKQVNDSFGHDAGDQLIRTCADRLVSCMRKSDSVARIGGDEFTVLLKNSGSYTDVAHIAQKLIEAISHPISVGNNLVNIGCSIGIAIYPDAGTNSDLLLKHSDLAMYQAKQHSESYYHFFSDAMNQAVQKQLSIERDMTVALRSNQFELFYQPRVDLTTGKVVALEALIRWQHPEFGIMVPGEFLGVAEDTGLIVELGYWIVERACKDLRHIRQLGFTELSMSVNLSARQFQASQFVQRLQGLLEQIKGEGVHPRSRIEFELSESAIMCNIEQLQLGMTRLAKLGCAFVLDDFGTGYSSFMHLQRLPLDALKIDHSFVRALQGSSEDRELVQAMISLAKVLNKRTVAEGVESEQQVELLRDMDCDMCQGYLFSPPDRLHNILSLLQLSTELPPRH